MAKIIKRSIHFVVILLFLFFGAAIALNWIFNRPPVNMVKLTAIKEGASREEVQATLGKPTNSYETNSKWAYSKPLGWSIVYIYFDQQGRFKKYEYDY